MSPEVKEMIDALKNEGASLEQVRSVVNEIDELTAEERAEVIGAFSPPAGNSVPPPVPSAPATRTTPGPVMDIWYYRRGDQRTGPVSSEELKRLAQAGELQPSDLIWKEGMPQPVSARQARRLFPDPVKQATAAAALPTVGTTTRERPTDPVGNAAKAPNTAPGGQKLTPPQLRAAVLDYVLREDSSLPDVTTIREFLTTHRHLVVQSKKGQERLRQLTAAISAHSPLDKSVEQKRKELATAEVELGKIAQSLGHAAFHASLAGRIEKLPVFAERLQLHRKIADLEAEKLSPAPPENAGVVQKAKAKAQKVVILGKIKLASMNEGSLETAIGKNLLHNSEEETVRCDQTNGILESIGKQRSTIATCRTQVSEAQTLLENKRIELCQSLGLEKIDSAATLEAELRKCKTASIQNEKLRRDLENALPDKLLAESNLPQDGQLAEMINTLRLTDTKRSVPSAPPTPWTTPTSVLTLIQWLKLTRRQWLLLAAS